MVTNVHKNEDSKDNKKAMWSKFKFITIFTFIIIFILLIYQVIKIGMDARALKKFTGVGWGNIELGFNSNKYFKASTISVLDLKATLNNQNVYECPSIVSDSGHTTLSIVGDTPVCCWVAKNQRFVQYKDIKGFRHYLCGEWPYLEHVKQPLTKNLILK